MTLPKLKKCKTIDEYRKYFKDRYCNTSRSVTTFDGITVVFKPNQFKHSFYESSEKWKRDKKKFSLKRAERIDWIDYALKNADASLYIGYNKKSKIYNKKRRVCLKNKDYVVVIEFKDNRRATFITAFTADKKQTLNSIKKSPTWNNKNGR